MSQRIAEKPDYTHITIVLDRSGSMESVAPDTIGGFNKFITDQKAVPGKATISLIQFDNEYEEVYLSKDLQQAPNLTDKTFVPRGSTALLDAMGHAIEVTDKWLSTMQDSEKPAKIVFAIMTDGEENASHKFNKTQVFDSIKDHTDKSGWAFIFMGTNQDAIQEAGKLGIGASNTLTYSNSGKGAKHALMAFSANVGNMRTSSLSSANAFIAKEGFFSDADRDEQTKC